MSNNSMTEVQRSFERATIPYLHSKNLEFLHFEDEGKELLAHRREIYQKKIDYFLSRDYIIRAIKKVKGKKVNPLDTIKVREFGSIEEIPAIANEATIYFTQGFDLLKASQAMPVNSSPLVEYYALLQCVKGSMILELDFDEVFFSFHGLTSIKKTRKIQQSTYLNVEIKELGVFPALIICFGEYSDQPNEKYNELEKYLDGKHTPSIEEIITKPRTFLERFIGVWMVSTLVRYKPVKWEEILSGAENMLIDKIRTFRRVELPNTFDRCLPYYVKAIKDF